MSLAEELRGAKIIRRDDARDLTLVWYGGHGIHVLDADGREVAFQNVGDWARDEATPEEIMEAIDTLIALPDNEYPWAY